MVRLLGQCGDANAPCQFDQNGQNILVVFSGGALNDFYECARSLPADRVLVIEVTTDPIPLKKLGLGRSLKPLGPALLGFRGYVDEPGGLVLKTYNGKVIQLNYIADAANRSQCRDYYENLSDFVQVVTHCPPVALQGPDGPVKAGDKITFQANAVADPKLTLSWNLSAGKIIGAMATRTISVDTAGLEGQLLTVTVQARSSCAVESSFQVRIVH